jgi:hypothetical protein
MFENHRNLLVLRPVVYYSWMAIYETETLVTATYLAIPLRSHQLAG